MTISHDLIEQIRGGEKVIFPDPDPPYYAYEELYKPRLAVPYKTRDPSPIGKWIYQHTLVTPEDLIEMGRNWKYETYEGEIPTEAEVVVIDGGTD